MDVAQALWVVCGILAVLCGIVGWLVYMGRTAGCQRSIVRRTYRQ